MSFYSSLSELLGAQAASVFANQGFHATMFDDLDDPYQHEVSNRALTQGKEVGWFQITGSIMPAYRQQI